MSDLLHCPMENMDGSREENESIDFTALVPRDSWSSVAIQSSNQTPGFMTSSISPRKYPQATLKEVKCQVSPPSLSPQTPFKFSLPEPTVPQMQRAHSLI